MTTTHALRVQNLSVVGSRTLIEDVSLVVPKGKIVALFGSSGAGKSTTLLSICGLQAPRLRVSGAVMLGDRDITTLPPEDRSRLGLSIVLQGLALFPHLSVVENIAYPLRRRGVPAGEARSMAARTMEDFRLVGLSDRRPTNLSGGEQQRVAIARAMVASPSVLLLDEPFKGLDQRLRDELLGFVLQVAHQGTAILLVTHERREIDLTADVVIAMSNGRVTSAPEQRSEDFESMPFRAVEGHVRLPAVGSFAGGWVPASDVRVVANGNRAAPSGPISTGQIMTVRNIGNNRIAVLCHYAEGVLGWVETDGSQNNDLVTGGRIDIEYRPQNGVQL